MLKFVCLGFVTTATTLTILNDTKSNLKTIEKLKICGLVYIATLSTIFIFSVPSDFNSGFNSIAQIVDMAK